MTTDSFRSILCPVELDEDEDHSHSLVLARRMATAFGSTVSIAYVVPFLPLVGQEPIVDSNEDEKVEEDLARKNLEELAQKHLQGVKYQVATCDAGPGHVAGAILRMAERTGADLIVMGTHGRKGVRRLVLGSVAEAVVRQSHCPVMTVQPEPVTAGGNKT